MTRYKNVMIKKYYNNDPSTLLLHQLRQKNLSDNYYDNHVIALIPLLISSPYRNDELC